VDFQDKTLVCVDCGAEFIFSAKEQEFYAEKGFTNEPKRCKTCRANKKQHGGNRQATFTEVTCANCGAITQVPFTPRGDRPVYCRDCFQAMQQK